MIKKIIRPGLGAVFVLLTLSYLAWQYSSAAGSGELQVVFFDIGQGDAIFINTPYDQQILIDGGPDDTVLQKLGEYMPFYDRDLDLIILTHPHADHVSGLVEVLKRYAVDEVWLTGVTHTSGAYLEFLDALKNNGAETRLIVKPENLVFRSSDDQTALPITLQALYPLTGFHEQTIDDLNDSSIVTRLVYGENEFLFTGDAGTEIEHQLLDTDFDLFADVLKIGHHGSTYSTTQEFLTAVNPTYAVIQSGAANSYGHPHRRVLDLLKKFGVKILRNDQLGDIVITGNGQHLTY